MQNKKKKISAKKRVGLPPGALLPSRDDRALPVKQSLFEYNSTDYTEKNLLGTVDYRKLLSGDTVSWLNLDGVHDSTVLEEIGTHLGIHPLILEDIQTTDQRPKIEDHKEYLFITFKMLSLSREHASVNAEQVSLIVGGTFVVSFQEYAGDVFDSVRQRITTGTGRIRRENASYLGYALLDAVVDNYFLVLEELENRLEEEEENILASTGSDPIQRVYHLKRQLTLVRRNLWPLREVLYTIQKEDVCNISENVKIYFGDVFDHTLRLMDNVEMLREMALGLVDLHTTNINNNMNSVMKVLTVIATIFIPITFIAGVYGMNFAFMPELAVRWAYPVVLGVMGGVVLGMIIYFKKKRWF
jgi:magnesium transporter